MAFKKMDINETFAQPLRRDLCTTQPQSHQNDSNVVLFIVKISLIMFPNLLFLLDLQAFPCYVLSRISTL